MVVSAVRTCPPSGCCQKGRAIHPPEAARVVLTPPCHQHRRRRRAEGRRRHSFHTFRVERKPHSPFFLTSCITRNRARTLYEGTSRANKIQGRWEEGSSGRVTRRRRGRDRSNFVFGNRLCVNNKVKKENKKKSKQCACVLCLSPSLSLSL